ncbi:MAG TPA: hypothetical protein V6C99_09850 [Oculatellaceae cyanobacterium]|jgi:drug/metabolite transporter (DMT)-like permease
MKGFPFKLMLALLLIDVAVMVCNKVTELNSAVGDNFYGNLVFQPTFWLGLLLSLLQLWTWTSILARTRLSLAYPVASLSYPLTMLAAQCFFAEKLSLLVWLGGALITFGVAIVGSASEEKREAKRTVQERFE